jgi:hypothetical protein
MEKQNYYLYCHTNKINGKKYIGISKQLPSHRWQNGKGYKGCPKFERAIKKYGWENFEHEILFKNLTKQEASNLEQQYIEQYDTVNNGYNVLQGGLDNSVNGANLFDKQTVNQYTLDKQLVHTWESAMEVERELGFNHGAITSACRREAVVSYNYLWRYADDCSDINDIVIQPTNCFHDVQRNRNRKVNQYDLQGNFIKTWNCILDIAKAFNKSTVLFTNCCNRKPIHKNSQFCFKSAYGYQWRYIDDCDDIRDITLDTKSKVIYELDKYNNIIHIFNSIQEVKTFYNDNQMLVVDVCCGKQKTTRGHVFCYKDNYQENLIMNTFNDHLHSIYVLDLEYNIIEKLDSIKDFNQQYLHRDRYGYSYEIINNKLYHRIIGQKYHICDVNDYQKIRENKENYNG